MRMWCQPFKLGCGWDADFTVGTTRYVSDWKTGVVEVAAEHVGAALAGGFIPADHPQALAGLAALRRDATH